MRQLRFKKSDSLKGTWSFPVLLSMIAALIMMIAAADASVAGERNHEEEMPFAVAEIYFELNNTDGDLGIHSLIDGEAWRELEIEDPRERKMLDVRVRGRLGRQGLTEIFFESAEPTFDELPPKRFFRRFPEGIYEIEGETLEGDELESEAELTHLLPAPPADVTVNDAAAPADCDEGPVPSVDLPVVISWEPVTLSHPELGRTGEPIEAARYQAVVEYENEDEVTFVFSTLLPPSDERMRIMAPSEFIQAGLDEGVNEFKFEILVRETSGNQTAVESCFEVE